ncbi:hypothetical protein MYSI104531_24580 [Mycobacterium simiae]
MAAKTRCSRPSSVSTDAASNTSVRYSNIPRSPAGSPVAVKCSVMENDKSVRAV